MNSDRNNKYSDVPQILRDYLNFMTVIKNKSQNTVREYYYDLRIFFRYICAVECSIKISELDSVNLDSFDDNWLKKITLRDLYEFLAFIHNEKSSNDNYKARKVASLKSFFNYLHTRIEFIENNPTANLDSPKIKKTVPRHLTFEEAVRFLKCIDGKFRERDLAMFVLFLNCGLRLSELVGINLRSVDFAKRTLRVVGKGNKERIVFLNDLCLEAINGYMAVRPNDIIKPGHKDALFISSRGTRISNRMVELIAKKYFQAAGLDYELFSPHKLRHTAATLMFKEGNVDLRTVQELLGHASLSTTQIYTHIGNDDLRDAANKNPLSTLKIETISNSDAQDE